ncbi:MAG: GNAT family N-acetyltransferase [Actinomycetota bacterium]|nr:GNAT family N-acetyltransferase [Actinomycetota bacterium]
MTGSPLVRIAAPEDAAALGRVHVRAWQATYRGIMPEDFLDNLDPAERGQMWASYLTTRRPMSSRLVICAEPGDEPVGFALVGPDRESASPESDLGELYAINLDPDAWGQGLGRDLLAAATTELSRLGFREAVLWVATANARARRFYEVAGWHPDGTQRIDDSLGPAIDEVRYRRSLTTRTS